MTICVYKDGLLACDSLAVKGTTVCSNTTVKVRYVEESNFLIAFAGTLSLMDKIIDDFTRHDEKTGKCTDVYKAYIDGALPSLFEVYLNNTLEDRNGDEEGDILILPIGEDGVLCDRYIMIGFRASDGEIEFGCDYYNQSDSSIIGIHESLAHHLIYEDIPPKEIIRKVSDTSIYCGGDYIYYIEFDNFKLIQDTAILQRENMKQ